MPKRKTEELVYRSKSEKLSLKSLCSIGRAAYGSVRNLSKVSGLSKLLLPNTKVQIKLVRA